MSEVRKVYQLLVRSIPTTGQKYTNYWSEVYQLLVRSIPTTGQKYTNYWSEVYKLLVSRLVINTV
jgi:hypothetical protein